MKTTLATLLASVCLLFMGSFQRAQAQDVAVDFDYFYNELTPYGDWIEVEGYGYCFRPFVSYEDETWQPYTVGTWVESDAGWTWMSEEDFGWACYHYGRWLMVEGYWVWVPGYEWGPGWVSWRYSEEYVGWAPLPPEARWNSGSGIHTNVDVVFDIGPRYYSFISIGDFGVDNCRPHLIERSRNVTIINSTINITNITYRDTDIHYHRIHNGGPRFDDIRRFSRHDIRRLKLDFNDRRRDGDYRHRSFVENDRLAVFAPRIERRDERRPPKEVKARIDRDKADRGWRGIEREQASRIRQQFAEEKRPEGDRRRGDNDGPARAIPLPRGDGERMEERDGRGPDSPRGPRSEERDNENRRPGMPAQRPGSDRNDNKRGGENENTPRPGRPVPMPEADRNQQQRPDGMRRPGENSEQRRPDGMSQQEQQRNRERMEERMREQQREKSDNERPRETRPTPATQPSPAQRMKEKSENSQLPQAKPRPQENRERPREMERPPQQQQQRPQAKPQPPSQRPEPRQQSAPKPQARQERPNNSERRSQAPQQKMERRPEPKQARPQPKQKEARGGGEQRGGAEGRKKKDD